MRQIRFYTTSSRYLALTPTEYNASGVPLAATAANNAGVILLACTGNQGDIPDTYPACDNSRFIGVGATNKSGNEASFSNSYGADILAPGESVAVANKYDYYQGYNDSFIQIANGTSYSTPMVAGVVAKAIMRGKLSSSSGMTTAINLLKTKAYGPIDGYPGGLVLNAIRTIQ